MCMGRLLPGISRLGKVVQAKAGGNSSRAAGLQPLGRVMLNRLKTLSCWTAAAGYCFMRRLPGVVCAWCVAGMLIAASLAAAPAGRAVAGVHESAYDGPAANGDAEPAAKKAKV